MPEPAIQADELVRQYKKGPRAVDGIDLAVAARRDLRLPRARTAPGKSTTVHMLTTLLPPTSGSARVAGFDVVHQGAQVRMHIGAALQEAALDPLLTGREHLRLQASLQGIPRAERTKRSDELLGRVGLREAADRKVRGYSGGMKRRLDLALALVHRPEILFLDEPTTGLDIQSRTALWGEVSRLASEDGVTVFLTTQYLEEADVLADRVGIIDHGRIVAEGTPAALKAEVGRSTVEAIPADAADLERTAAILDRFGELVPSTKGAAVRLERRPRRPRRDRARARPERAPVREPPAAPALARRRLPRQDRALARGRRRRGGARASRWSPPERASPTRSTCSAAARSCARCASRRTSSRRCSSRCCCSRSTRAGSRPRRNLPGFPTNSFVAFALAVPFIQGALFATMNTGTDLARDIQTGFLNRLTLTPMRGIALLCGQLGGVVVLGLVQAAVYLGVGLITGVRIASGPAGVLTLFAFAALVGLAFGALGAFAALRTGSGEAVQSLFPAFFVFLFISSMNIPRNLIEVDLVPRRRHRQPGLVPARGRPQPDHHRLGRGGAGARLRDRRPSIAVVALVASSWALRVRMAR